MSIANTYPEYDKRKQSPGDTVYYVNPIGGDDSNNGLSSDTAWKTTISLNALRLAAGDRVELSPGRYEYSLCLTGEGSTEKPVVIHFAPDPMAWSDASFARRFAMLENRLKRHIK